MPWQIGVFVVRPGEEEGRVLSRCYAGDPAGWCLSTPPSKEAVTVARRGRAEGHQTRNQIKISVTLVEHQHHKGRGYPRSKLRTGKSIEKKKKRGWTHS
jgi:hypothetical protein